MTVLTQGARLLKRGDTFDPECHRTTYRLGFARRLLIAGGIEPTWEHSDSTQVVFGRERHACDNRCKASWPEWATDEAFNLAYRLADEIQTERGNWHQGAINREQAERRAREREEESA